MINIPKVKLGIVAEACENIENFEAQTAVENDKDIFKALEELPKGRFYRHILIGKQYPHHSGISLLQ